MAMPSGRGLGRHCQAHHAGAVVTTEGICRRLHAFGRPAEVAGTRGTAPSRRPRLARDALPCSRTRPWGPSRRWRPATTGMPSRGASATPGGYPASAHRARPPRGPCPASSSSCSSRSCRRRGSADGRARAASTGTTCPGASSTGRGDRAPRAGGPPPPRARGHRGAARHLRQVGLRVADHVITLREFRGQAPLPDRQAYLRLREGPLPQHREGGECASPHRLPAPTCPCALGPGGRRSSVAAVRRRPWGQVCCEGARRGRERGPGRPRRPQGPGYDRKID